MQTTNAKPIKKSQWLLVLILAPLLAGWLGHQSPPYAVGNGGVFQDARHVTWTPATSPMTVTPAAQQKGHSDQDRKPPYAL
ncbi:hypothetical protein NRY68_03570 [Acidithiobacillus ferrooxidans]|uniref:hypothetical protein n=1 Tax=Acidithiobacillus ferrooxidans TaxID=920 RepID=UPI002148EE0D|nr:hypothetical protein [Acidithiobacillus ferrooxidans]MCR1344898.1 hypothetical protein [Acidithiobacillus ferrooxidans]MCR1354012.1 hypothetical protein [Acidithiobacillus ferrooxidans]